MLHAKTFLAQVFPALAPDPQDLLLEWRSSIKTKFPSVRHVTCAFLQSAMEAGATHPLLLDFRTEAEHLCSHISGSVRVDPDASPEDILLLLRQHAVLVPPPRPSPPTYPPSEPNAVWDSAACARQAVFYCSIGYRSSAAAARVLLSQVIPPSRVIAY